MRTITTMDSDCKTVNIWEIPEYITLHQAIKKQDDQKFRGLYFVSSYQRRF